MFTPRPYQEKAIRAPFDYWAISDGNPLIVAPTASGKALMIAEFTKRACTLYPGTRILVLAHVAKLLKQNAATLIKQWPHAPLGFYSASLGRKDHHAKILFAGIQSIYRKASIVGHVDLILIDEAHLISPNQATMYRQFIAALMIINPKLKICGYTATPYRQNQGYLTEGKNPLFTDIAFEIPVLHLLEEGYLTPVITPKTNIEMDVSSVGMSGGDFVVSQLDEAVNKCEITEACVTEVIHHMETRNYPLVFCVTVKHAENTVEEFKRRGLNFALITGDTKEEERDIIFGQFERKEVDGVVNVMTMTTGIDIPCIDLVVLMRPLRAPSSYVQIVGRGMRLVDGSIGNLPTKELRLAAIASSAKPDCIAEGQKILTDIGLVPIEKITKQMKVWDGVAFVRHGGIVSKGIQNTIEYAGLIATPDHKVWTEYGWKEFKECAAKQIPISITGYGGMEIKLDSGYNRSGYKKGREITSVFRNLMQWMWEAGRKSCGYAEEKNCWVQKMWTDHKYQQARSWSPKMATAEMCYCEAEMHKQEGFKLPKLWGKRNQVQVWQPQLNGQIHNGQSWFGSVLTNRQNRQQRSLRAGESSSCSSYYKYEQSAMQFWYKTNAFIQRSISKRALRRRYNNKTIKQGFFFPRNRVQIFQPKIKQTKRQVWDILNAGPRNRFTCQGLLVSNCMVLDFGGVVKALGPIDNVKVKAPGNGTGDAPIKQCPKCLSLNHAAVRVCFDCGYEWPEPEPNVETNSSKAAILSSQIESVWYDVDDVYYDIHMKTGKPDSIKISYHVGVTSYPEWVFPENPKMKTRFAGFWIKRGGSAAAIPQSAEEAAEAMKTLDKPTRILVRPNGKFDDILEYDFGQA